MCLAVNPTPSLTAAVYLSDVYPLPLNRPLAMPGSPQGNQAGGGEPPERRTTFRSPTFDSFRRRGTGTSTRSNKEREKWPFQEHFSCYEGLTWEALRGYLERKWPGIRLAERRELDQWLFEIPERLTDGDRDNIAALRDINTGGRRRQRTP
ncbi:uncharacterized protein K444DRAFT_622119, partial [Hyaloscypha bicolor E]